MPAPPPARTKTQSCFAAFANFVTFVVASLPLPNLLNPGHRLPQAIHELIGFVVLNPVEHDDLRVDAALLQLRDALLGRANRHRLVSTRVHREDRQSPRLRRWRRSSRDRNRGTES